ncbi:MAG: HEAT repeat domain-containing protein [Planctomycetes bacterium]|nr:HEAT repeat domain-containing protein [Planctomycetota bacterium]
MPSIPLVALLTSILALAAGGLPAQAGDPTSPEARLDAVREFTKFFKKAKDEPTQVEAVQTLKGNECRPAAEELLKLLKHPSAAVQQAAFEVLGTYRDASTYEAWIQELPKAKDAEQAAVLVKVLGQARLAAAVPAIEGVAGGPKATPMLKFEAARALQNIGAEGSAGLLGRFAADGDPLVRMAAADAIGALRAKQYADAVIALLRDNEWQVQSAAVAAVAAVRPQHGVQPLIDLMRKAGRLRTECADALFRITGFDFGVDPERWQEQWNALMSLDGYRIPTDEELAKKAESRKKSDAFYGNKEQTNTFARIPTTSTNVLFIIDVSGSMDDLVVEVEKFQGYRDRKRFTVVQTELLNTLDTLTADTNFDILAFATDIHPWKKRLVPANVVNRDAAKAFVRGLKPLGGKESQDLAQAGLSGAANLDAGKTNTLKALLYAFGEDPDKPSKAAITGFDKGAVKRPLDTVYFLSDGRPSVGKLVDSNEILKEVRRHNEVYRMVIHTIAIGDFQKEFLRQLAQENGGEFVDLGR